MRMQETPSSWTALLIRTLWIFQVDRLPQSYIYLFRPGQSIGSTVGVGEMVVTRHDSLVVALFLGVDLG